jgi:catechol 2,3-dioxygenase-like lactoylglutathione lyase family enzyme
VWSNGDVDRPQMRMSGPVLDAPDVTALTHFYERLLGWEVEELEGPRPGRPAGDGWARLRPADRSTKIEIQFEEHYARPVWPGAAGAQGMQLHLDIWVEDVPAGVAWAIACGATEADRQPGDRDPSRLRIMLDPAGHPFCLWS